MEKAHPGLIETGAKSTLTLINPINTKLQCTPPNEAPVIDERIKPQRSAKTNTPEYDQEEF